jgi:single-stranded-DNA-specific exonuclease
MVDARGGCGGRASIVLASTDWHQGVVGIVASRLVERYHRPTILIALSEDGQGKGSGRSIPGFHLLEALTACAEHLERFGGHRYAAGIAITSHRVAQFAAAFESVAAVRLSDDDLRPRMAIDAEVAPDEVTPELAGALKQLAPFGVGNPEPILLMRRMTVTHRRMVGAGHQKLRLNRDGHSFDAIAFNQADRVANDLIDIAFYPEMNEWNGSSRLQLRIKDQRPAE